MWYTFERNTFLTPMNYKKSSLIFLAITTLIAGILLLSKERTFYITKEESPLTRESIISIEEYRPNAITSETGKAVAQIIAQDIVEKNPEGPRSGDGLQPGEMSIATSKPEEVVEKILSAETGRVRKDLLSPVIDQEKFIIGSKETAASYLTARSGIIESGARTIAGFKITTVDDKAIKNIISVSDTMIDQFYALPIPREMIDVHTEQIRLLTAERGLLASMVNREKDPVAAALAVSLIPENQKAMEAFQQKLVALLAKNGLKP